METPTTLGRANTAAASGWAGGPISGAQAALNEIPKSEKCGAKLHGCT